MSEAVASDGISIEPVGNRVQLIDSVRAIALGGVIIYNLAAMVAAFLAKQLLARPTPVDLGAAAVILFVIQGKARSCFALLFGVGFGILMDRVTNRGHDFGAFYLRRMVSLLAIGVFNLSFLFWGDILILYAALGMVLLPFRKWEDRSLLRLGLSLVLVPPIAQAVLELMVGGPLPNLRGLSPPQADELIPASIGAYRGASFGSYVVANWHYYIDAWRVHTADQCVYATSVFGLFLIGLVIARRKVFVCVERWRPLLRRVAIWSLPIGFALSFVQGTRRLGVELTGPLHALPTAAYAGLSLLAFGYIALLCLWLTRSGTRVQRLLAPAGRMALTGYLGSNAIGAFIFYGWGLGTIDRWNVTGLFGFGLLIFLGHSLFAAGWLKCFRYGPAEWLWRSLTYGYAQPMLRRTVA